MRIQQLYILAFLIFVSLCGQAQIGGGLDGPIPNWYRDADGDGWMGKL